MARGADFPVYSGSSVTTEATALNGGTIRVSVRISAGGKPVQLTDEAPVAATQSSTLGVPGSVPRNVCVDSTSSGWSTYLKLPNGSWQYEDGFLPKGHDAAPPANATLARAQASCAALAGCLAITVHDLQSTAKPAVLATVYFKNTTAVTRPAQPQTLSAGSFAFRSVQRALLLLGPKCPYR